MPEALIVGWLVVINCQRRQSWAG